MWYGLLLLVAGGVVLIFLEQFRLWCAAAFLVQSGLLANRRSLWLLFLPAVFLSAALLFGLFSFYRIRGQGEPVLGEPPQLYVLLDCSVSMTAEAWQGRSRLETAKISLRQLPSVLAGWELALVTFAGEPLLDFPPSSDLCGWLDALEAVAPERPPLSGSSPGRGLQLIAQTDELRGSAKAAILLFSDGEINVENPQQEEAAWEQRDLPCLFVLMGTPGDRKPIPDPSGWLSAIAAPGEAFSVADDQDMRRLLGLSPSPFQYLNRQSEAEDIAGLAERLQRLVWKKSGQREMAENRGDEAMPIFLLLAAACALLAIISSGHGLPKMSILLLVVVIFSKPLSLPAGDEPALELCREAGWKTAHPEDLRGAIGLYRQALRLQPGLPLAARNLEYTLLQLEFLQENIDTSSQDKKPEPDRSVAGRGRETAEKVPAAASEAADVFPGQAPAEISSDAVGGAVRENSGTWRDLQTRRRRIFRTPPKCNPW